MNSHELVLTACAFRAPPRIPRIENFWNLSEAWRKQLGDVMRLSDVVIRVPDESPFPSRARHLKKENGYIYETDGWGRTLRRRQGAYFREALAVALPPGADPEALAFEPPEAVGRFTWGQRTPQETVALLAEEKKEWCIFGKTGGPFYRSCLLRGEEQFLIDIAADPPMARTIAERVAAHLTRVGVEEIRRWNLHDTGIWIYDDMGQNHGPMFRPESFESVFLPSYRRMIRAYKDAGARYVFLHSDGNIRPFLDMFADAGIDGLNPLEARAGMNLLDIRKRYPRLILAGGMDNTDTLLNGPVSRIVAETRAIIDAGREGGVIIGTHSISPEIPLENYLAYHETCLTHGVFDKSSTPE